MANPFVVTPATSFAMQGLGQLAQATGGQFAQQRQQEQEAQTTQEFITLMGQAQSATDPAVKQRIFTEISANPKYKSQIENMRRQTALQMEQAELAQVGQPDIGKDSRTSTQKEYAQYQSLKKSDPESAKEFGRAAGFVDELGQELSVHLQKRLSDSTDMAIESRSNVAEFESLADQIEEANIGGGVFQGSWREAVKDATGQQDAVTALRKRYNAIKGSQVVKNLPPGAASDADIALALAGFPTDNASGPQLASFLRGVAKLEERQADFQDFKANYISENRTERGMLKAYRDQQAAQAEDSSEEGEAKTDSKAIDQMQEDLPLVNAQGWQLMTDANGNRAYVGPNNQFSEVR